MPDIYSFPFRLDHPVDEALSEAFSEVLLSLQGAMGRIAVEQLRREERMEEVARENQALRAEHTRMREEIQLLKQGGPLARPPDQDLGAAPAVRAAANEVRGAANEVRAAANEAGEAFALVRKLTIHDAQVHSVCMGPGNDVVATASWDATVKLYDLAEDRVRMTLGDVEPSNEGRMGGLYAVAFARTVPEILGCTSCDHSVYLWNHEEGRLLTKLTGHSDEVNGIDFHTSQQVMCTASDDCKVIIWDFQKGITLRTLDKHTKAVYGATFLGQENQYYVASCCFDQKLRVFDMRDKELVASFQIHTDDVIGIHYSSHTQLLATGSDDGQIGIWDTRTWKLLQRINTREDSGLPENEVKRVAFSPEGSFLAAACSSKRVLVYDVRSYPARPFAELGGHTDCVFDITWGVCPQTGAKMIVSASHDNTCRYWREVI